MMDIFEDNYFDIIALPPSMNQCIQPSDYISSDACIYQDEFSECGEWRNELPCYAELKPYVSAPQPPSSPSSLMSMTELDQFLIFEGDDTFMVNTFDTLPSKTLMCTDECSAFLTESSEILRVNSLKIQQQDESLLATAKAVTEEIKNEEKVIFTCNFGDCKKTYSKPAHLRAHHRRHLGLKPFSCNFPSCSWKFSRSDELARHQRSHSGIKPYSCFYCSKTFSRSDHLKKHCKIHEKKMNGKIKVMWDEIPKQKPGRKKKVTQPPL